MNVALERVTRAKEARAYWDVEHIKGKKIFPTVVSISKGLKEVSGNEKSIIRENPLTCVLGQSWLFSLPERVVRGRCTKAPGDALGNLTCQDWCPDYFF